MVEGVAYGGLPFPDTGCALQDVYIYYVPDMFDVWGTVSIFSSPLDVFAHGHFFYQRIRWYVQWAFVIWDLQVSLG